MDNLRHPTKQQWASALRQVRAMRRWVDRAQKRLLARGFDRNYEVMSRLTAVQVALTMLERDLDRFHRYCS